MATTGALRRRAIDFIYGATGVVIVLFFVSPLLWTFSMSLKTIPELFSRQILLWPSVPQWKNYATVFQTTMILQYMKNSAIIVSTSIVLVLLISIPAAFALSRYRFGGKRTFLFFVLVFQMLSPVVIVIPLYRLFMSLGIYNRLWSLIVVYSASSAPFTVWYLKGYFDTIPKGLDEAARIDGASPLRTLLSVHIPVAVPGIASTAILLAVQTWSHFVFPSILLDDKKLLPISVGLLELQSSSEAITVHYLAASSIIGVLPILVCFIVFQKFIVSALTQGAIKE